MKISLMKFASWVPFAEHPSTTPSHQLTILAVTVALTLPIAATSLALAPPAGASRAPRPGATAYGNDISWPQCSSRQGGYGLPGPMRSASFAVVGLTSGGSFRANPCLARQVASAKARHLWISAYAISTYPTRAQLARYGGTGTLRVRLHRVGAAQARFNLATMARVGLRSPIVWVDIEPNRRPWSARAANNNAVINGVLARYRAGGMRVGIYSYVHAWKTITGGRRLPGVPTWVPVGSSGRAAAARRCGRASFSGSRPVLTQWTDGVRDYNLTCPGVTGRVGRNVLKPYMNLRLAVGARGGAVAMLQRRLGRLKVDGAFGLQTRARVVAYQRARHLRVTGIASRTVWRSLGARTGRYTPPLRSIMGSLFRST